MPHKFLIKYILQMKRTIIITGGTTGIGKATAIHFVKNNWNVVITSRSEEKGNAFLEEMKNEGLEMAFFPLDVRSEEQFAKVVENTVAKFGKLDSIVNNSAISLGAGLLADTETEEFKQQLDTNVLGVYYGMKYAIRAMLKTGGGTIVNLASIAGLNGLPYTAQYSATKHAVVGLTKAAAQDYAQQGIRINAVAPGAIKTDILKHAIEAGAYDEKSIAALHPMNRMGDVQDIALAIYYLASPDNHFLTGTILNVDGGYCSK